MAGEGWWRGFKSIDQLSRSSEVEHNPKTSISFFWLERGGGGGLSPSTSPADHQKLTVIQKRAFHFIGWRGVADGFESIDQPSRSSEGECSPKNEHFIFWAGEGWWVGFESIYPYPFEIETHQFPVQA